MAEEEQVGSVSVHIHKSDVHKAVRNILANEMNLDPVAIKREVQEKATALIQELVINQINERGYGSIGLKDWAERVMERRKLEVDAIMKEAVRQIISERLQEECVQVVEAIIKEGLQINVGWNRKIKAVVKKAD